MTMQLRPMMLIALALALSPRAGMAQEHELTWYLSPSSWERPDRFYLSYPNQMLDVAAGSADDVLVTGEFETSMTFGGRVFELAVPGEHRQFAARLSSEGALVWKSDPFHAFASGVAPDGRGGFYLSAEFQSSATIGDFSTGRGPVLVRFDDADRPVWTTTLLGDRIHLPVRADPRGHAYVATAATGPLELDEVAYAAGPLGIVSKQRADGVRAWSRVFSSTTALGLRALAAGERAIYVAGEFTGTLSLGEARTSLTSTRSQGFIAALSPLDGSLRWVVKVPGGAEERSVVRSIAPGDCRDLFIAGNVFSHTAADTSETHRMFVARVSDEGVELWRKDLVAAGDAPLPRLAMARSVTPDHQGGVLLAALVGGRVEFDGVVMATGPSRTRGSALLHMTARGRARDGRVVGSEGLQHLATDSAGNILLAGHFWQSGSVDDYRVSGRYQELFVAKLGASDGGPSTYSCGPELPTLKSGMEPIPRVTLPELPHFADCLVDGPNCMILDRPSFGLGTIPVL